MKYPLRVVGKRLHVRVLELYDIIFREIWNLE